MAATVPSSEIGTAIEAISVARGLCRKAKITSTTITTASTSSSSTCSTEERMPSVRSVSTVSCTLCGRLWPSCGSFFLIASTVAITLAPGWRCTFKMIAGDNRPPRCAASPAALPPEGALAAFGRPGGGSGLAISAPLMPVHAPSRSFSEPSMTRATAFRRTGAPPT